MPPLRALLLLLLPALAACPLDRGAPQPVDGDRAAASEAGGKAAPRQTDLLAELAGSHWQLVDGLPGHDPDAVQVTLAFEGNGRISGSGGCNGYSAEIAADAGSVQLGPVAATKRGCLGARNQVEVAWFGALAQVETLLRDGGSLLLLGEGVRLRLAPAEIAE